MGVWYNSLTPGGPAHIRIEVQSAGGWVDVTADVLHPGDDVDFTWPGRQTELDEVADGHFSFSLNNDAGTYTPGYPSAPVMLEQGMPVRVRETVGRVSLDLFTGTIEQAVALFSGDPDGVGDQVVVTGVDWSGGQEQGRTFISNLGEWIVYHGGDALAEYWPMTEATRPWLPVKSASSPPIVSRVFAGGAEPADGFARITPAAGDMPLGEDAKIPVIGGPLDSLGLPAFQYHLGVDWFDLSYIAAAPPIALGEVCTTVVWIDPVLFSTSLQELFRVTLLEEPSGGTSLLTITKPFSGPVVLEAVGGGLTGTVTGGGMETGRPYPIAIRHGASPSVFELWMGRKRYTGSLSGSPPAGGYAWGTGCSGAFWFQGSYGHMQIYVGAESDYTFDNYLAQIDFCENALTGGYRFQRTDERLLTLSQYAGKTAAECDFDRGGAYMERAALAGKTYKQAAAEAVATEQGRLFTAGNGNSVFHNRIRTKYAV